MIMEDAWENILKKYDIIDKKGSGASSVVYLVKDSTTKKTYSAKILKKQSIYFENEIKMLNALKEAQNPYILNLVNSGTWNVVLKDKDLKEKQYLILEYASKGSLYYYTEQYEQGLKKEYVKVIFDKILKGVLCCHEKGICHRDLKLDNILLVENFNPKIADFGFATVNSEKLKNNGRELLDMLLINFIMRNYMMALNLLFLVEGLYYSIYILEMHLFNCL